MTQEQDDLSRNIFQSGNTFGSGDDRLTWLRGRSLVRERSDYVYFVGCMNSYRYQETAKKTFSILSRFGATLLPEEQCCGSPLLRMGFVARELMEENCRQIREIGAGTVITGCAGCYTTLKNNYGNQFQVLSVPEFLAQHISEIDLKPLDITVTYHDPCHLGRHNRVYEKPRQVIRAICRLVEMKSNRKDARCCGGGGGVRAGYKDLSLQMARRRLEDVPANVDYIVTSCPLCIRNLRDGGGGERVIDLVDLVGMAMR
jgi:Fe-S oxidoreductase